LCVDILGGATITSVTVLLLFPILNRNPRLYNLFKVPPPSAPSVKFKKGIKKI